MLTSSFVSAYTSSQVHDFEARCANSTTTVLVFVDRRIRNVFSARPAIRPVAYDTISNFITISWACSWRLYYRPSCEGEIRLLGTANVMYILLSLISLISVLFHLSQGQESSTYRVINEAFMDR